MKKVAWIAGSALVLLLALVLALALAHGNAANYHFGEFASIRTNFNSYRPSISDWLRGIRDNQDKWDFHLQSLEQLGAVKHKRFVFTEVPYTREASKRIWRSASSNFPNTVMFTACYYDTNAPGYGVAPFVLEV